MSAPAAPPALPPREAYRIWAPSYEAETAISFVDDRLVSELTPPLAGLRLLDAGCGTARRLRAHREAALLAGADLTWEMLAAGAAADGRLPLGPPLARAAADVRALPFPAEAFDVVWCRLVVGHLPELAAPYEELGRVVARGGTVIVTDFHPDAARAGHTRSFRDGQGVVHAIEHHLHELSDHVAAAADGGLELADWRDGVIGPELRPFYEAAGRMDRYAADEGLPVVLALAFRRVADG